MGMMAALLPWPRASSAVNFQTGGRGEDEVANACSESGKPCAATRDEKKREARPEAAARSKNSASGPWHSRFSASGKVATLGLGADLGFRVARPLNLRAGFSTFRYGRSLSKDGVAYQGVIHLQSLEILADWFPFRRSFHVSSGVLLHNHNRITALANPPLGQVLTAGQESYISDPQNPIAGKASSGIRPVAPVLMIGFGNLVPRSRHFAYSMDFGVVFQGSPKSQFSLRGGACDPSGAFCANVADDGSILAEAQSARSDLDKSVSFMRYYPVVSLAFGYRF